MTTDTITLPTVPPGHRLAIRALHLSGTVLDGSVR